MSQSLFVGIDIGAETIKVVILEEQGDRLAITSQQIVEHHKDPNRTLAALLEGLEWDRVTHAAVTGRLSRGVALHRVPSKRALALGIRHLVPDDSPLTLVSIGSHGFCVLELREGGTEIFRENSRCSQGTGNFLRQLVERFHLRIEEASDLVAKESEPAALSGRCPVILKTDMTHLANKGETKQRILAGLYDAVAENVQVLLKPRTSPPRVVLVGGVARSARIRHHFSSFLDRSGMFLSELEPLQGLFVEALGAALASREARCGTASIETLFVGQRETHLDRIPPLSASLDKIRRIPKPREVEIPREPRPVILGYDIGSTGSKAVALDLETRQPLWQGYVNTLGAPLNAASELTRQFLEGPVSAFPVVAVGATGSGREIVGSLMTTCFGKDAVFVLNEIAAHAEGAAYYDPRVDTIFEIGGQDAKYIRLDAGRVVDAAMNEACSAGTGSFIEEQGRKFENIRDVVHLGQVALEAEHGVSLGQHCSVFMAEIIDEAVAAGEKNSSIIAGIYDSIIQNYLNRVKGSRSVGSVVFCQGMPFSSDALAAAVVRQTGAQVVIPPYPGTIGALGIALLARKELSEPGRGLDLHRFLDATVVSKDAFVCKSTKGCGGPGNKCRIDRITTVVDGVEQRFTWGGGCSLYDKGTRRRKLPDLTPDPFRQRDEMVAALFAQMKAQASSSSKVVAMSDEFALKTLAPLLSTLLHEMGLKVELHTSANQSLLKRGIEEANVPFCAPMQQYHGLVSAMVESRPDYLLLPMLRNVPRQGSERAAKLCPIVQASADMVRADLGDIGSVKILSPVLNFGKAGYRSKLFKTSCRELSAELEVDSPTFERAFEKAVAQQEQMDAAVLELGTSALAFARQHGITPVVVLGRAYSIYNTVLNSNVPAILREQGALPIPVDCLPLPSDIPVYDAMYWGYGQRNLRAASEIRRTEGMYAVYCSNYSCGPDSFTLHFFSHIMQGKPYAVIETDGHSGDAGTKTRIEAFLYCVKEDMVRKAQREPETFDTVSRRNEGLAEIRSRGATVLIPRMGNSALALAAALRGIGIKAEALPVTSREDLSRGRRQTSGKECVPFTLTLGSLLNRVEKESNPQAQFTFFMPTSSGPCRFGAYSTLHKLVIDRLGLAERVGFWSPVDAGYFDSVEDGFAALAWVGFMGAELMLAGLYDARPAELRKGAAQEIYDYYFGQLLEKLEAAGKGDLSLPAVLTQVTTGHIFGITPLLRRAGEAFAAIRDDRELPEVLVVGELYVRCDPAANDFVIDRLESRGIRCRFAAFYEWIEYVDYQEQRKTNPKEYASSFLRASIEESTYLALGRAMGWPARTTVQDMLQAGSDYLRESLCGEAILTVGGPVYEWRQHHIHGVVSVGPLECMPNKIAEAQLHHAGEREGLPSLTLSLNGDPVDPEVLDNFAYEIHSRFHRKVRSAIRPFSSSRRPSWIPQTKANPKD
ncbi:MAG: acyl-CoA dehydratase activase-related protein [Myxococcota bacterium]|jgi:predicted CoA-substrate-specific enzyme activase|nr:acyl-CoA dehydratase activase-related protein [Myxococcota bacterium]